MSCRFANQIDSHRWLDRGFFLGMSLLLLSSPEMVVAADAVKCQAVFLTVRSSAEADLSQDFKTVRVKALRLVRDLYPSMANNKIVLNAMDEFLSGVEKQLLAAAPLITEKARAMDLPFLQVETTSSTLEIVIPSFSKTFSYSFLEAVEGELGVDSFGINVYPKTQRRLRDPWAFEQWVRDLKHDHFIERSLLNIKQVENGFSIVQRNSHLAAQGGELVPIADTNYGFLLKNPNRTKRFFRGVNYRNVEEALEVARKGHIRELGFISQFLEMNSSVRERFLNIVLQKSFQNSQAKSTILIGMNSKLVDAEASSGGKAVFIYDVPVELTRNLPKSELGVYADKVETVVPFFLSPKWISALFWDGQIVHHRDFEISSRTQRHAMDILEGQMTLVVNTRTGELFIGERAPQFDSLPNFIAFKRADQSIEKILVLPGEHQVVQFYVK